MATKTTKRKNSVGKPKGGESDRRKKSAPRRLSRWEFRDRLAGLILARYRTFTSACLQGFDTRNKIFALHDTERESAIRPRWASDRPSHNEFLRGLVKLCRAHHGDRFDNATLYVFHSSGEEDIEDTRLITDRD